MFDLFLLPFLVDCCIFFISSDVQQSSSGVDLFKDIRQLCCLIAVMTESADNDRSLTHQTGLKCSQWVYFNQSCVHGPPLWLLFSAITGCWPSTQTLLSNGHTSPQNRHLLSNHRAPVRISDKTLLVRKSGPQLMLRAQLWPSYSTNVWNLIYFCNSANFWHSETSWFWMFLQQSSARTRQTMSKLWRNAHTYWSIADVSAMKLYLCLKAWYATPNAIFESSANT